MSKHPHVAAHAQAYTWLHTALSRTLSPQVAAHPSLSFSRSQKHCLCQVTADLLTHVYTALSRTLFCQVAANLTAASMHECTQAAASPNMCSTLSTRQRIIGIHQPTQCAIVAGHTCHATVPSTTHMHALHAVCIPLCCTSHVLQYIACSTAQ